MDRPNARDVLTEAQRACLRLVWSHHSSKEIALQLGVGPSAVDKRIERAVQQLGAVSRFEAARWLAADERAASDVNPSEPIDIVSDASSRSSASTWPPTATLASARYALDWKHRLMLVAVTTFALAGAMLVTLSIAAQVAKLYTEHPAVARSL